MHHLDLVQPVPDQPGIKWGALHCCFHDPMVLIDQGSQSGRAVVKVFEAASHAFLLCEVDRLNTTVRTLEANVSALPHIVSK